MQFYILHNKSLTEPNISVILGNQRKNNLMHPYLSVIIPAYNEEQNIKNTVKEVCHALNQINITYEMIIVDDGSKDNTGKIIDELSRQNERIKSIHHPENRGPGSGIFTGIKYGSGEFIIFIPADLAINPLDISKYIESGKTADVIIGLRSDRRDYSFFRKIISYVNIYLIRLLFRMKEHQFNYINMYRRSIFNHIKIESQSVFITAEIIIKAKYAGFRLKEVKISYVPRAFGKSSTGSIKVITQTFLDMMKLWLKFVKGKT